MGEITLYLPVVIYPTQIHKVPFRPDGYCTCQQEMATLAQLTSEAAGQAPDDLIPGGFGGPCEFSHELETAFKSLISLVHKGMTEWEQHEVLGYIEEAIAWVQVDRYVDDEKD